MRVHIGEGSLKLMIMLNTVLCIDDSKLIQDVTKRMIRRTSFARNVVTADNGREALDYLRGFSELMDQYTGEKAGFAHIPDLIFLDLNMPLMNGWKFLDRVENLTEAGPDKMKIIIVSSSASPENIARAKKHSLVYAFISKPLTLRKLEKLKRRPNLDIF